MIATIPVSTTSTQTKGIARTHPKKGGTTEGGNPGGYAALKSRSREVRTLSPSHTNLNERSEILAIPRMWPASIECMRASYRRPCRRRSARPERMA